MDVLDIGGKTPLIDKETGLIRLYEAKEADQLLRSGSHWAATEPEWLKALEGDKYDQPLTGTALGAIRGITFGLSDAIAPAVSGWLGYDKEYTKEYIRRITEENPIASTLGEVAGFLTPIGAAGLIGRGVGKGALMLGARGVNVGKGTQLFARSVLEGGGIGLGSHIGREALRPEGTRQLEDSALDSTLKGVGWGAALGLAGIGLGKAGGWLWGKVANKNLGAIEAQNKIVSLERELQNEVEAIAAKRAMRGASPEVAFPKEPRSPALTTTALSEVLPTDVIPARAGIRPPEIGGLPFASTTEAQVPADITRQIRLPHQRPITPEVTGPMPPSRPIAPGLTGPMPIPKKPATPNQISKLQELADDPRLSTTVVSPIQDALARGTEYISDPHAGRLFQRAGDALQRAIDDIIGPTTPAVKEAIPRGVKKLWPKLRDGATDPRLSSELRQKFISAMDDLGDLTPKSAKALIAEMDAVRRAKPPTPPQPEPITREIRRDTVVIPGRVSPRAETIEMATRQIPTQVFAPEPTTQLFTPPQEALTGIFPAGQRQTLVAAYPTRVHQLQRDIAKQMRIVSESRRKVIKGAIEKMAPILAAGGAGMIMGGSPLGMVGGGLMGYLGRRIVFHQVERFLMPAAKKIAGAVEGIAPKIPRLPKLPIQEGMPDAILRLKATRILTDEEYEDIGNELRRTDPKLLTASILSAVDGAPPQMGQMVVKHNLEVLELLRDVFGPAIETQGDLFGKRGSGATMKQRIRASRILRTALAPEAALLSFAQGKFTKDERDVLERLPLFQQAYDQYKQLVRAIVTRNVANGGRYTRHQQEQIKLFLGEIGVGVKSPGLRVILSAPLQQLPPPARGGIIRGPGLESKTQQLSGQF